MRAGDRPRRRFGDGGSAVLTVLMVTMLLSSLALSLVLMTILETWSAANFRSASETQFAAEAGLERALVDLAAAPDWSPVLDGSSSSTCLDGADGQRTLADGTILDLTEVANRANCGHAAACSPAEMDDVTAERPWGPNNPRWRLFIHATLDILTDGQALRSSSYVVVLVGDDPSETDADPLRDGIAGESPGAGVLLVRSQAFGSGGARKIVEATVMCTGGGAGSPAPVRLVSWRAIREPVF